MSLKDQILFFIFLWSGKKLFNYIDIYAPKDNVEGITFSNTEQYIDTISEIEL